MESPSPLKASIVAPAFGGASFRSSCERSSSLRPSSAPRRIQKAAKFLATTRMAEFAKGLHLDLPDALSRSAVHLPNFFERAIIVVIEAEAQANYFCLPFREAFQCLFERFFQSVMRGDVFLGLV